MEERAHSANRATRQRKKEAKIRRKRTKARTKVFLLHSTHAPPGSSSLSSAFAVVPFGAVTRSDDPISSLPNASENRVFRNPIAVAKDASSVQLQVCFFAFLVDGKRTCVEPGCGRCRLALATWHTLVRPCDLATHVGRVGKHLLDKQQHCEVCDKGRIVGSLPLLLVPVALQL